jgi:hypothetical protein
MCACVRVYVCLWPRHGFTPTGQITPSLGAASGEGGGCLGNVTGIWER